MGLAAPGVVVAVTKNTSRGPKFSVLLVLGLTASVLIVGFQNCAVDLSSSTPGASTSGACGSPPAQALPDMQNVIGVLSTNCASCHAVNTGSVNSGFYTPEASADASDSSVQSFAYTQLCVRGGLTVGLKIDGTNSHGGGAYPRGGGAAALYNYLDTYF